MPSLPVAFTRRAARRVDSAVSWWRENRTSIPDAVREDLDTALELIANQPASGAPVPSRVVGLRRVFLGRVGYHLYYRVAPRLRQVQVIAFWHARRGSSPVAR